MAWSFRPIRFLLTAMLAAAIPLCCCRGEMLAYLLAGPSDICAASHATTDSHAHAPHRHADEHAPEHNHGCGGEDREPCDDGGPCDCEHQRDIKSLPDPATSIGAGSGVLVGILPALDGAISPAILTNGHTRLPLEAAPRPPTTLLSLRCALII